MMSKLIKQNKITIPIVQMRQQVYLIGSIRANLDTKFNSVIVRISGGGVERFDQYVPKNQ
jgi:hypothetical protein